MKEFFYLFPNCVIVKGHIRSTINDLSTGKVSAIPNEIALLFEDSNCLDMNKALANFIEKDERKIVENFLLLFVSENFGFFSDTLINGFNVKFNTDFNFPFAISNIIVDIDTFNYELLQRTFSQINEAKIRNLELRIFNEELEVESLQSIYELVAQTYISSFTMIISNSIISKHPIDQLFSFRLTKVIVFNSDTDKQEVYRDTDFLYARQKSINVKSCGLILEKYFTLNIPNFTESLHHNSCLNRKISIDTDGNIKNCPSMKESFGNIRDTSLTEALEKPGFKKYWDINKDKIHVCKDCEFRHVCTDCRAYVEEPEDILSKPLKCGYDPYVGEWSDWSTNPLKQKAIDFYGM